MVDNRVSDYNYSDLRSKLKKDENEIGNEIVILYFY